MVHGMLGLDFLATGESVRRCVRGLSCSDRVGPNAKQAASRVTMTREEDQ